jgi:hypothetical protein
MMSSSSTKSSYPDFGLCDPEIIPELWKDDLSKIDELINSLRLRHSEPDIARIIVLAASRNITQANKPLSGYALALLRRLGVREKLKEAEGGSVSAEQARSFLGNVSRQTVLRRYNQRKLVGWKEARPNSIRFPVWQFSSEGLLPGMAEVLEILKDLGDWNIILFFLNKRSSLGGRRPLDALRCGELSAAKRAAFGHTER